MLSFPWELWRTIKEFKAEGNIRILCERNDSRGSVGGGRWWGLVTGRTRRREATT